MLPAKADFANTARRAVQIVFMDHGSTNPPKEPLVLAQGTGFPRSFDESPKARFVDPACRLLVSAGFIQSLSLMLVKKNTLSGSSVFLD